MMTFITFKALELMAKIEKSLKFKPHYKIVEEMKEEAEKIREQALEEGRKEGLVAGKIIGFDKGKKEGVVEGELVGIDKGEKNKAIDIAKNLLSMNMDIEIIMKATGLTIEDIDAI